MKRLITILGLVTIAMAIVVEINSSMFVDFKFCAQDFGKELYAEPLTPTQKEFISNHIADVENAYLAEVNRKRNAAKFGFYSLLINGLILFLAGLISMKKKQPNQRVDLTREGAQSVVPDV